MVIGLANDTRWRKGECPEDYSILRQLHYTAQKLLQSAVSDRPFACLDVILLPLPVFAAIANPDTAPTIWDVHVNRNVISQGDIVFTGLYNIPYATPPTATADQTFIIRLMDPTGTTDLGSVAPFNYTGYHNGYNQGSFSLYFAPGNTLSWGTTYIIQIAENPSQFASPLKWNTSLTAGMYTSVTAQTDNQTDLASQIYTIGSILATDFNEKLFTLVGSRQVLYV